MRSIRPQLSCFLKSFTLPLVAVLVLAGNVKVSSAVFTETHTFSGLNLSVPDGDLSGASDTRSVMSSIGEIGEIQVSLQISGTGFTGDIYAHLTHETGFSVLLNRVGRRLGELAGYDDFGFNLTFNDNAANGDVHPYRLTLSSSHDTPLPNPGILTGTWAPDGRATSPLSVLDTDSRTATLGSFSGLPASGDWTLYVADVSGGGQSILDGWELQIAPVPEPEAYAVVVGLIMLAFAFRSRSKMNLPKDDSRET